CHLRLANLGREAAAALWQLCPAPVLRRQPPVGDGQGRGKPCPRVGTPQQELNSPPRSGWHLAYIRCREMKFAYSESAQVVRSALGAVLRGRREAQRRTLSEV